jgi:hypothetical protein
MTLKIIHDFIHINRRLRTDVLVLVHGLLRTDACEGSRGGNENELNCPVALCNYLPLETSSGRERLHTKYTPIETSPKHELRIVAHLCEYRF